MEDTGLQSGAAHLRQQELLLDYTLKVQDQEFRVHKCVLASVSDYFHAMLCGSMSESMSDKVELKELNAEHVSELLKFIYTANSGYINENPKEMLELAVYFQMPKVIQKCRQQLMTILNVENCLDLLCTFETYSVDDEVSKVGHFIKNHVRDIRYHYKLDEIPPNGMRILLDNWDYSEWNMFDTLYSWLPADSENRNMEYFDDFLSKVRYSIMTPQQIKDIMDMVLYKEDFGPWSVGVQEADEYHRQTILQKVTDDSVQREFRFGKLPFVMNLGGYYHGKTSFRPADKYDDKTCDWLPCEAVDTPDVVGKVPFVLEVNNFLVTCSEFGEHQTWQVFDPLTLSWAKMPNMPNPKDAFAMVYHDKHLYVLGGCTGSDYSCLSDTAEDYCFKTNSWSSAVQRMPVAVKDHSACVLNGAIYVSGGEMANGESLSLTTRLDCLDLSSKTWTSKASMLKATSKHKMSTMIVDNQEAIIVIDRDLCVRHYNPVTDQWSTSDFAVIKHFEDKCDDDYDASYKDVFDLQWGPESRILVSGNTIYLLKVCGQESVPTWHFHRSRIEPTGETELAESTTLCVKWRVEDKSKFTISEFAMGSFPIHQVADVPYNIFTGVVAFPKDLFIY